MKIEEAKAVLLASFATCATPGCLELIDQWPDADADDGTLLYIPRLAVFAGTCSRGHFNEANLAEVKAGEVAFRDVTERTLGHYVTQEDCTHGRKEVGDVPAGTTIMTMHGHVTGPAKFVHCHYCCAMWANPSISDLRALGDGDGEVKT